ncbi:MAG TPA: formyltransferase family protein [Gemmatimonadales bacterium]|jgi:folate-dependent phosphoribosylglycinamide formyltransferase PurN
MLTATRRARLRVALLSTSRAPGLDYLLERDPGRGRLWEMVGFIATDPANRDLVRVVNAGIPAATPDIRAFYSGTGAQRNDLMARREFDRRTVALLEGLCADLIVTCGYLHILTAPLLEAYPNRVINIHDSDLPAYPGLHAVRDAVLAGERATRSTVHLVTAEVDGGPLLVRSWAFPTHPLVTDARRWGATDILKAYAYAQREWMMRASWGPLLAHAIGRFADGQVEVVGTHVRLGGMPGPHTLDPVEPALPLEAAAAAASR